MQTKKFFKYFGIIAVLLVGGFLVAGQIAYYSVEKIDPPGEMYRVNGGEIHMYCTGPENDSRPTIIIMSGGGTPSYVYDQLRENLSKTIRTCSYDLAGFGWSEPNNSPLTVKNMSDELHLLLQAAQIDGPIILAGHSMGGLVSLVYSAEHKEQVAGIAFVDSSHYNQVGYFGEEFVKISDRQTEEFLANFWLVELGSRLGIMNLMNMIFSSSDSEQHRKDHEISASLHRWNPPYAGMKSVISNFKLSLEQAKEAHYDREDLPIISLSASHFPLGGEGLEEFSEQELIDAKRFIHQDLADLSSNGKHVVVNGTSHMSILHHDETAEHILSIVQETSGELSFHEKTMIERYKDLPEVIAFYAKYPDADEEVRSDHVSYFVGSDDSFKVRMNLYFDGNYDLDYMSLKCYLNRELQTDVAENFISKYLQDFTCNEYGSQRNEN